MVKTAICGIAGEQIFSRQLKSAGLKQNSFDSKQLVEIAQSLPCGRHRLKTAMPCLLSEYGRQQGKQFKVNWQDVPANVILDYVFGVDVVINFRGWCIGIDITTNKSAIADKQAKLKKLQRLWSAIGIDYCAVAYVSSYCCTKQTTEALRQVLKGQSTINL